MEVIGVAANAIAVVDLSVKVAAVCLQYAKDVKNAAADINRLRTEVAGLEKASKDVQQLLASPNGAKLEKSQSLESTLKESRLQLEKLDQRLKPKTPHKAMSRIGLRALKWPFQQKDVEGFVEELRRHTQDISFTLQVDQTAVLLEVDENILYLDQKTVLGKLPVAIGATFDSHAEEHNPTCLPNTRTDLLRQISEWAEDPHAEAIFWLNGMAGTGKSTISRTVARSFAQSGLLGASFFFKTGEADRGGLSHFFTTLAAQLVKKEPTIAPKIKAAIDIDPQIVGKVVQEQFEKLILEPLSSIAGDGEKPKTLVIIVDALDECDRDEDIRLIITLFSQAKTLQPSQLRIFVTSRPELPIRLGFSSIRGEYHDIALHEIPEPIIEHDISAFLGHELAAIRTEYNTSVPKARQLPLDWPGESNPIGDVETPINN
ncbi:hypothetical protein G7Z17_g6795 [Cylindrodendrum hubeiense]|uniref:NACHT domain-containing protein n=1 Tax=Cylindrodendrum hubeiense TaxID=595255 RepID=A0A9P5H6P9_9HYPO|nr:hypothetical protein G7Z17_g6795 [Cylindrodendrum hubeiense]